VKLLAEKEGKVYASVAVDELGEFLACSPRGFFASLIWDHASEFSDSDRATVAKTLLDAGCRYVVCGGQQCSEWHDAVDLEFVKRHLDDDEAVADASHVMTTWHEGESPDDVAFFFVFLTNFDRHDFTRYLVVHVGTGESRHDVDAAVRRCALGKRPQD
jgi:hypothetical protein